MSRSSSIPSLALLVAFSMISVAGISVASADEGAKHKGLQEGDPLGVFHVTKIAGAIDDAVEPGETLCYRCRYGSRPMVLVFARDTGGKLPDLLKAMDKAVGEHEDAKLAGVLTLLGEDAGVLKDEATKVAAKTDAKLVPVAVAKETKTGPLNYKLSADAEVTVIIAQDSQVVKTHEFTAANIDVDSIINEATEMLN